MGSAQAPPGAEGLPCEASDPTEELREGDGRIYLAGARLFMTGPARALLGRGGGSPAEVLIRVPLAQTASLFSLTVISSLSS
jgi:hypothetical protein